ncbi:MAG: M3 family metallopeptidase [Actinomycetota bacterium]|nr:M3 family metallopeptidase [Actinomycetota bacterium]
MSNAGDPLFGHDAIPLYSMVQPSQIGPAIDELIERLDVGLTALEQGVKPTYANTVLDVQELTEPLEYAWLIVSHLMAVNNSDELRAAYEEAQPKVVAANLRLGQSKPIYEAMRTLKASDGWASLTEPQQRIVESSIRSFERSGVALEDSDRDRFQQIASSLAELGTKFTNNVLDSVKAYRLDLTDEADVDGLPATARAQAAQAAVRGEVPGATGDPDLGPWRITLDLPSMVPFLQHSTRRDLREKIYRASITRASQGELDNQPIAKQILELRKELSGLLGFATFAELSLSQKMAPGVDAVFEFIDELQQPALPKAASELASLTEFARRATSDQDLEIENWDLTFWSERLREETFSFTDEQIRPFFPLPQVLEGLFDISQRLFGVRFEATDPGASAWDPEVKAFKVIDEDGSEVAHFFLDAYSRPQNKRGGAWMSAVINRKRLPDGTIRKPVAILNCNQTPPLGDVPSLMSFTEVNTLFHEFGHGIQQMLTEVDELQAAGLANIEWDAVELASTFMQNWCYHNETMMQVARHHETGEHLDDAVFEKLKASRVFLSGLMVTRQNYFSIMDMELHQSFDPTSSETVLDRVRSVASRMIVKQPMPEDRFFCSFQHIFSGGYAAGYYSYLWAAVLASDAFAAFEEAGTSDQGALHSVGRRFRETILASGGGRHPLAVFEDFRSRPPSTEPLMRQLELK